MYARYSLVTALSSQYFEDFTRRVANGALTVWHVDEWTAKQVASKVAEVAKFVMRRATALEELDACRAKDSGAPANRALRRLLWQHVPLGDNPVHPKASNTLRQGLHARANAGGPAATAARQGLASLECSRRDGERPAGEPRHGDLLVCWPERAPSQGATGEPTGGP